MIFDLVKTAKQCLFDSKKLRATNVKDAIDEVAESMTFGEVVSGSTVGNSANAIMPEVNVYGKSTQAGEPTPSVPVDIVSVDKALVVKSCGKNLLNNITTSQTLSGITYTVNSDKSVTCVGTSTGSEGLVLTGNVIYPKGTYKLSANSNIADGLKCRINYKDGTNKWVYGLSTITINDNVNYLVIYIQFTSGTTVNDTIYPMLRLASIEDDTYEPYIGTQANLTLTDDLRGIPVSDGGNYTDANGQQWICDTLEKYADGTGKLIKRVGSYTFEGTSDEGWYSGVCKNGVDIQYHSKVIRGIPKVSGDNSTPSLILCNQFLSKSANNIYVNCVKGISFQSVSTQEGIVNVYDGNNDLDAWLTHLASNPMEVVYILNEYVEIDLTAEQVTALEQLQSFKPYTTLVTDSVKCAYLINSASGRVINNHNHDNKYSKLGHNHNDSHYLKSETYSKSQTNDAIATGLNQQLKTKTYNAAGGQGAANEVKYITVDVTLAGYTPLIGVVTSTLCVEAGVSIAGNTATVTVRNGSDAGTLSATISVLYTKNNGVG